MMMRLGHQARRRQERGWITPMMAITRHSELTMRASIVNLDHRCQHLADVPVEGLDFVPVALDSPEPA
jgi:hypothetical protein